MEIYDLLGIRGREGRQQNRIGTVFSLASFAIYKLNKCFLGSAHQIEF